MPYILIRHKVSDYAKWKHFVQDKAQFRKSGGETSFHAYRDSRDPNDVTILCQWDTADKMEKFIKSPELRQAMKEAGVLGEPTIQSFSGVEDLSVR